MEKEEESATSLTFGIDVQCCPPPTCGLIDENQEREINDVENFGSGDYVKSGSFSGKNPEEIINDVENLDLTDYFRTNKIFNSRDELINWTRDVGRTVGTVVIIMKSDMSGRNPRITFGCERGGTHINVKKHEQSRRTGTKKCGCPFQLRGTKMTESSDQWIITVQCGLHNHSTAKNFEGHAFVGRLNQGEKQILVDMSKAGVKPREVLKVLKEKDENNSSTMTTIYNARSQMRLTRMEGRSQMQELLKNLAEHEYVEKHRCVGDTDRVQDLFWAHPKSIQLAQCFPNVFLMDCTYKTNRYRMPLFEIVGVTSTMMTFSFAFVYLDSEKEENYIWALASMKSVLNPDAIPSIIVTDKEVALMNAIKKIFPNARNFLCRYHISRNILARCKKMFEDGEKWNEFIQGWNEIVHSSTVEEYSHSLSAFEEKFMKYPYALTYVKDNWLMKYKECFVAAWTDQNIHFGNTTTNRVESSHARLKRHLGSSQGNLETSWSTINSLLSLLHSEIHASFERSLNIVMHNYAPDIFKELRGFISRAALDIIVDESKRADSIGPDAQSCMCVRRRTHGLPCAHEIANYKREGRPIPLSCIHYHWKKLSSLPTQMSSNPELDCTPLIDLFLEKFQNSDENIKIQLIKKLKEIVAPESSSLSVPNEKLNTRGRPSFASFKRFAQTEASTKRDPSAFELVLSAEEKNSQRLPPRKKLKVHRTQVVKHNPNMFLDSFPSVLLPIIQCVMDVKADGNCGFRVIAKLLGKHEDEWRIVRRDLAVELQFHRREYTTLYGNEQRVDELMNILNYSGSEPAPFEKWMTIPDMGYVIASRYNMVLCTFSMHLCLTFLPLRSTPDSSTNQKVVAIGFVNGNHFVEVVLTENSPLPPIGLNWYRARHPLAAGWEVIYVERIEQFKKIMREGDTQWDSPIEVHD